MNGHKLARKLIEKHGKDRYPQTGQKLLKLVEEVGELIKEFNRGRFVLEDFIKEYADVGLTLYEIGNALHIDLEEAMRNVVEKDNRKFA